MSLSSLQLDAFVAVSRLQSFSKAANSLHVTQSALSQRIAQLEGGLRQSLFIRDREGVRLTPAGERLLQYCQAREAMEREAMEALQVETLSSVSGLVRVAGFSSIMRSVAMPALAEFLRLHPRVRIEFFEREIRDLRGMLQRGEADFVILDSRWERAGIGALYLGEEHNVLVESTQHDVRKHFFLDHDSEDSTTDRFFALQGNDKKKRDRCFLDDVYGILDGVSLGLGRAVLSRHLIPKNSSVRVVRGYKPLKNPVLVHYFEQPFYTKLHQEVLKELSQNCREYLESK